MSAQKSLEIRGKSTYDRFWIKNKTTRYINNTRHARRWSGGAAREQISFEPQFTFIYRLYTHIVTAADCSFPSTINNRIGQIVGVSGKTAGEDEKRQNCFRFPSSHTTTTTDVFSTRPLVTFPERVRGRTTAQILQAVLRTVRKQPVKLITVCYIVSSVVIVVVVVGSLRSREIKSKHETRNRTHIHSRAVPMDQTPTRLRVIQKKPCFFSSNQIDRSR